MEFPLDPWQCFGVAVVAMAGAYVQGSVGFGLGLIGAPLLLMIDPMMAPAPLILAAMVLNTMMARADREAVHLREVGWALASAVPGTAAGAALLWTLPQIQLEVAIAVMVLLAVGLASSGWHAPPTRSNLIVAGFLSGMMGISASIGGPPMAIVYSRQEAAKLRGTLAGYFICIGLIATAPLVLAGKMTAEHVLRTLPLLPGIAAGFIASRCTARWVPQRAMRPLVLIVAALGAAALILRAVL